MAHKHTLEIQFTGPDIPEGDKGHYHRVPGEDGKTSTNKKGPRHTHTFLGKKTSGPIEIKEARKHVKKKKKKKKPSIYSGKD